MFARIRWQLVGWTMLVVALILAALGLAMYVAMQRGLLDEVDRDLADRADQAAGNFVVALGGGSPQERERFGGGVFYLVVAADGRILANPQRVDGPEALARSVPPARTVAT